MNNAVFTPGLIRTIIYSVIALVFIGLITYIINAISNSRKSDTMDPNMMMMMMMMNNSNAAYGGASGGFGTSGGGFGLGNLFSTVATVQSVPLQILSGIFR